MPLYSLVQCCWYKCCYIVLVHKCWYKCCYIVCTTDNGTLPYSQVTSRHAGASRAYVWIDKQNFHFRDLYDWEFSFAKLYFSSFG